MKESSYNMVLTALGTNGSDSYSRLQRRALARQIAMLLRRINISRDCCETFALGANASRRTKGIVLRKSVKSSDFEYGGNKRQRDKAEMARWSLTPR